MRNVDDTKFNLETPHMSAKEREELRKKLAARGGATVEPEKKKRASFAIDRDTQRKAQARADERRKQAKAERENSAGSGGHGGAGGKSGRSGARRGRGGGGGPGGYGGIGATAAKEKMDREKATRGKGGFLEILSSFQSYIEGVMGGVVDISGKRLSKRFLSYLNRTVLSSLLEAEAFIGAIIFPTGHDSMRDDEKQLVLAERFGDSVAVELLERYYAIYDQKMYDSILGDFKKTHSDANTFVQEKAPELKEIFKRMHVLKQHLAQLHLAAEQGLDIYRVVERVDKTSIANRLDSIKKSFDIVFDGLYPKMLVIMKILAHDSFTETSEDLNTFLDITEEDRIGYLTERRRKEAELLRLRLEERKRTLARKEKGENGDTEEDLADHINKGLAIIGELVRYEKRQNGIYDETHPLFYLNENDKIFRAKILLDTFDAEYSIVLLTTKIEYNITYDKMSKGDYASRFNQCLSEETGVNKRIRDYIEIIGEIVAAEHNPHLPYEHRMQLIQSKEVNRSKCSKFAREALKVFLESIIDVLTPLIENEREQADALVNPTRKLTFEHSIHGRKRVNGKTAVEALTETYQYIRAFHYLITDGELGGAGVGIEAPDVKPETVKPVDDGLVDIPVTLPNDVENDALKEEGDTPKDENNKDASAEPEGDGERNDEGSVPEANDTTTSEDENNVNDKEATDSDARTKEEETHAREEAEAQAGMNDVVNQTPPPPSEADDGTMYDEESGEHLSIPEMYDEMAEAFNKGEMKGARKSALKILALAPAQSKAAQKALFALLASFYKEEDYERVLSKFDDYREIGETYERCQALYERAQKKHAEQEKEAMVRDIADVLRAVEINMRELIMHTFHNDNSALSLAVKEMEEDKDVAEGTGLIAKWRTLRKGNHLDDTGAPLISYAEFEELVALLTWIERDIEKNVPDEQKEEARTILEEAKTLLRRAIPRYHEDEAHHRLRYHDRNRLMVILVDTKKCADLLKDLLRLTGYFLADY